MNEPRTIRRRDFHCLAAAAATLAASGLSGRRATAERLPAGDYVAVHTHLGQTWNTTEPLTAEELLRWMDAHRVAQAVVLPLVSPRRSEERRVGKECRS